MSNKLKRAILITQIILAIITTVIIGWDIIVAVKGWWGATVSRQTMLISQQFPFIPMLWGILASHFFMGKIGRKFFKNIPETIRYAIWIPIASIVLILCIVNLFKTIAIINFFGEFMAVPLFFGQILGLLWYQNQKAKDAS